MIYEFYRSFGAEELSVLLGGELSGEHGISCGGLSTDSRDAFGGTDAAFAAIRGERFDGHDYIMSAVSNGAKCVICEKLPDSLSEGTAYIRVDDTTSALGRFACAICRELSPITAAVTGSVGKTTTKQLLYSIFSTKYKTHFTKGNFNNQLGLPLTVFGLREDHRAAVFEFGMSARGEISALSRIAQPDYAVITNIGSSHLEYLGTRENIAAAKLEIRDGLKKSGKLILNGDEPLLAGIEGAVYVSKHDRNADTFIRDIRIDGRTTYFDITICGLELDNVMLPVIGEQVVFDAALAMTAAYLAGIGEEGLRAGTASFENTGLRGLITEQNGITFIRDCYNAAPESMRAALDVMKSIAGGRMIAVLGDMRELGESSPQLHYSVGQYAAGLGVSALFAFGESAAEIARGALEHGCEVFGYTDISDAGEISAALNEYLRPGDTVLFKASRAVEIERVADSVNKISD